MTTTKKAARKIRVGARVGVRLAGRVLRATVIEDRGDLGPGGTHVYRVEVEPRKGETTERHEFEVPVDALEA